MVSSGSRLAAAALAFALAAALVGRSPSLARVWAAGPSAGAYVEGENRGQGKV